MFHSRFRIPATMLARALLAATAALLIGVGVAASAERVEIDTPDQPGYVPTPVHAQILRGAAVDQHAANRANATVDKAIEAGIMFAGTPDQVFRQIKQMYDHVGGFGHLLIMGQAGFLEHDETVRGIKTFAREVYPRLKEAFPDTATSGMREAPLGVPA